MATALLQHADEVKLHSAQQARLDCCLSLLGRVRVCALQLEEAIVAPLATPCKGVSSPGRPTVPARSGYQWGQTAVSL